MEEIRRSPVDIENIMISMNIPFFIGFHINRWLFGISSINGILVLGSVYAYIHLPDEVKKNTTEWLMVFTFMTLVLTHLSQ